MTDREAIEYAENELESTSYTLETNNKLRGGLFKILSTKFEFLVTAKSALQEREKRSKGCEFCDGTERSMMFRKGECAAMNDEVYVSGDAIIIDYGCKAYDTVKIGFCPMCGRPLKGEDND